MLRLALALLKMKEKELIAANDYEDVYMVFKDCTDLDFDLLFQVPILCLNLHILDGLSNEAQDKKVTFSSSKILL